MVITLACLLAFMVAIAVFSTMERIVSRVDTTSSVESSTLPIFDINSPGYASQGNTLSSKGATESVERYNDLEKPITVANSYDYRDNVEELLQYPWFGGGCEPVSLTAMLVAMGYDVTAFEICDDYLEYGSSFVYTYSGSPYYNGMAYPPAMVNCANAFLETQGSPDVFVDLTGREFEELQTLTSHGVPVLVWTTMSMEQPMFTGIEEGGYEWYENEHCVLVLDIDDETVRVMDPIDGIVIRDRASFEDLYGECGKMAASLAAD